MTQQVQRKSKKRGRGRPSEYHEEIIADVCKLIHAGLTDFEIAEHLGIGKSTFQRWKLEHPEFRAATNRAKDQIDERVERTLFERATGYSFKSEKILQHEGIPIRVPVVEHVPPDVKAATLWLNNRNPDRWKDRQDVNLSGGLDITNKLGERELALALIQTLRDAGDDAESEPAVIEHQEEHQPAMVQVERASRRFG